MEKSVVAVVGGGLAGLTAAVSLLSSSLSLVLLEKESALGGNSAKATSGINGADTLVQHSMGVIKDSCHTFFDDTIKSGSDMGDEDLVRLLTENSSSAIAWLMSKGVKLDEVQRLGGHSEPRTHRIGPDPEGRVMPIGLTLIKVLKNVLEEAEKEGKITILTNCTVKALKTSNEVGDGVKVVGLDYVKMEEKKEILLTLNTSAIILATGGYGNDHSPDSLLNEFVPSKANLATTNGPFAEGQGVKMARGIGAKLVHMDHIQVHPTGFIDPKNPSAKTKFLAPEMLRGCGAILVNHVGQRFCNELDRRDVVTDAIDNNCDFDQEVNGHVANVIMNQEAVDKFGKASIDFYMMKGFFQRFDNATLATDQLHCLEGLEPTLISYNEHVEMDGGDQFGKKTFPAAPILPNKPLYVARVTPVIHYTMGGLAVDSSSAVLSATSSRLKSLFAAGEVSGGVHGNNRLAGNSLLECVVFGRIAAQSVLDHLDDAN